MTRSANPLDIRSAIAQVETALVDVLDLAYRYRYPEAADLTALANYDAQKLADRSLVYVVTEGVVYRWTTASTLSPLAPYVIAPNVLPPKGNGRWIRQSSSVTLGHTYLRPLHRVRTGFARAVQIYQGEDDEILGVGLRSHLLRRRLVVGVGHRTAHLDRVGGELDRREGGEDCEGVVPLFGRHGA